MDQPNRLGTTVLDKSFEALTDDVFLHFKFHLHFAIFNFLYSAVPKHVDLQMLLNKPGYNSFILVRIFIFLL